MIPGKIPDEAIQIKFRDEILELAEQAKNDKIWLYFFDPCHCIHNNYSGYEWQIKGRVNTKVIKSNTGRKRLNVVGGLEVTTLEPHVFVTEANCNTQLLEMYLESLREKHPDRKKKIVMILDNAKYQHNATVKERAKELNIELKFLPAYCPNLNLIERLWKFLKKIVRTNNYCEKFEDFQNAIVEFFENISQYQKELNSLLTLNFEIIKAS